MLGERYLIPFIRADLAKKMVFIAGPRQSGKTWLSKKLLNEVSSKQYYNWDESAHRKIIRQKTYDRSAELVVFDELHKLKNWKTFLKGIFDTEKRPPHILVTGSARLDVFRRGGDSLLGRYFHYRLHPFSLKELVSSYAMHPHQALDALWTRGGFPEPLFSRGEFDAARWRKERYERILREDVLSLEQVRQLGALENLVDLLRERIGSTLSYQSLAEDLSVSPLTVKAWITLLERMYVLFIVTPYHKNLARAIKKESKVYFYDSCDVDDADNNGEGARFENLIAAHLMKEVNFLEDTQGKRLKLHFVRDKEKREVDFVITLGNRPIELIEAKLATETISPSLLYYARKFPAATCVQVVKDAIVPQSKAGVRLVGAADFLAARQA